MSQIDILERIAGAMLGLACGDALGAPAEYRSRDFVERQWGRLIDMTGGGIWDPGEWTDDTAMALCTADGILDRPDDPVDPVGNRLLTWSKKTKDIHESVSSVLDAFAGDWVKASSTSPAARAGRAAGNASLARTLPVALAYPRQWEMLTASARLSALTHWDPRAEVACAIYSLWIDAILAGANIRDAWYTALDSARRVVDYGPLAPDTPGPAPLSEDFWDRLANVESLTYAELQPSGYALYVLECLEAVAWCCINADDAEDAVTRAVNLAGDADTLGALSGAVAGAYWGLTGLPARWVNDIVQRDRIVDSARRLDELRRHNVIYATPGLPPFDHFRVAENMNAGRGPLSARDARALHALGVTDILDLRTHDELGEADTSLLGSTAVVAETSTPLLGSDATHPGASTDFLGREALAMIDELGLRRRHLPLTFDNASSALGDAHEHIRSTMANPEGHIYIHARSGTRRIAAVLAAHLAVESMMTYDEVIDHLADQMMKSSGTKLETDEELSTVVREWLQQAR